jgi:hypothetical protein
MRYLFFCLLFLSSRLAVSQDDLLNELQQQTPQEKPVALSTFKGTRVLNGHSIETKPGGALEFIISHRFGTLNSGSYELWGLDNSVVRIGLEYGITDRLGVGIGRSSDTKVFDGYVKYKAVRQQEGGSPVTVTALGNLAYMTLRTTPELTGNEKTSYAAQVMIARKFSSLFSLQVAPVWLHRNSVDQAIEVNDLLALGLGGRVKITRSVALTAEYYARMNEKSGNPYEDAIGFGIDIETGGHVFQLIFTNTAGMTERTFLPENTGNFFDGDIHFGFNITRTFQLAGKK